MEMKNRAMNVTLATFVATTMFGTFGLNSARADDDNWTRPGWYQVFVQDVFLIYSGPYTNKPACVKYVQERLGDQNYMSEMGQKYGKYGDLDSGWHFNCLFLKTSTSLPDD
jgi:hypothetical protein